MIITILKSGKKIMLREGASKYWVSLHDKDCSIYDLEYLNLEDALFHYFKIVIPCEVVSEVCNV